MWLFRVRVTSTPSIGPFSAPAVLRVRSRALRIARILVILGLIVAASGRPAHSRPGDDPKPPAQQDPVYLFLNAPDDLDAFWKLIGRPDRVVLDGDLYRKLRQSSEALKPKSARSLAVIEALKVNGRVVGDWAHLSFEYRVVLEVEGPEWVPVRLDALTLSEAREGSKDLASKIGEDRGWQVELRGKGEHIIKVDLIAPVKATVEGKRIELTIPPVASTAIDIIVPQNVLEASTGLNEKLAIEPGEQGNSGGTRLQARLSPRSKLELAWRERLDPAAKLPPLLEATGDLALEVDRDSIQTRSTWGIRSIRGTVGQITLRLDLAEEVLDVLVDDHPVLVETRREAGRSVISIPLAEPLRPESSRAVVLTTRRGIGSEGTVRPVIEGYAFDQAKVQSGMIAIARSGPLFINSTTTRGLRRIDPRTELSDRLRNRADTVLAFKFSGPPFELGLSIESAPPRLRIDERTTITLDPRSARLQSRLDCQTSQGSIFEVKVLLPPGLDYEGAEPAETISSVVMVPLDTRAKVGVGLDVPRMLTIKLKPQAIDSGSFWIGLKGWSAIDPSKPVAVPLFRPEADASHGGRFVVVTDRNVSAELASGNGEEPSSFRIDWGQPPADWIWPERKPSPEQSLLWLRSDASPDTLPLKVAVHPRTIHHDSTLTATIDRKGADVVEEISGEVAFGTLAKLDLAIPREVGDRWEVEGLERTFQEPLEAEPDGSRPYRIKFPRSFSDTFRLRLRYHLPLTRLSQNEPGGRIILAPIRVLEGTSTGRRVLISAEPGVEVQAEAKGWSVATDRRLSDRISLTRTQESAGPVVVLVRPGPQFPLPGLVVSRLWLRTAQRLDNDLATSAYFWVETRENSMVIGLEPGSRWVRARVGTTELGEGSVEQVQPDEYRLRFPASTPSGPVLVAIDYTVPVSAISRGWPAPKLLNGGVIQQTVWEAQVLGTRAGVGTPSGWLDENEWYWDGLIWQRRPWKGPLELASWLTGGNTRYRLTDSIDLGDRGSRHSYVFSRVGPPTNLRFPVYSRFSLLLLCSGPALLAGLLVLARRPPPRWIAASVLTGGFAFGSLVEPDVLILVLQSSALGVALWLTALVIHWWIERRNPRRPVGDLGSIVPANSSTGSTFERAQGVGSDDSTAIRVRPITPPPAASTADHIVLTRNFGRPPDEHSTSELDIR
jgi:hypothetical protein